MVALIGLLSKPNVVFNVRLGGMGKRKLKCKNVG